MAKELENLRFYQMALELFDNCWNDCEILMKDFRGKELARQLIRSVEAIPSNIEEGYGRGSKKEYPHFLVSPEEQHKRLKADMEEQFFFYLHQPLVHEYRFSIQSLL